MATRGLPAGADRGPLGRRLLAGLLDAVVPAAVAVQLVVVAPRPVSPTRTTTVLIAVGVLVAWACLAWWALATRAASPGMRLTGLRLVGFGDGRPVGPGRVLVRALLGGLLGVTVLGLVAVVVATVRHPLRRSWPDQVVDAVVVTGPSDPRRSRALGR